MKLVLAIVQDTDSSRLLQKFNEEGVRATKLSSTGGFLKEGNTTFVIGVEKEKVKSVLTIIENTCQARTQRTTPMVSPDIGMEIIAPYAVDISVGGATVFILPVEEFFKF